jgi:hypothetical protein
MPLEMYLNWLFEVRAKGTAFLEVPRKPKLFDPQKGNPHRHDTTLKIEVQTLTNGRYDEFPELAETTYVGSAVYDVYRNRVIGFVRRDTLYGEANLEPEVVSRWLSTDPIHHPYQSPYVGFDNNPVYYVDPNGTTVDDYHIHENGVINVIKTADKTDSYFYHCSDGSSTSLGTYNKNSKGYVEIVDSKLINEFYFNKSSARHLRPEAAAALLGATYETFRETGYRSVITQLNDKNGFHSGAQQYAGSIDIAYISNDPNTGTGAVQTNWNNFDKKASQNLLNRFRAFGYNGPRSALTENAAGNGPELEHSIFVDGKHQGGWHHKHHIHFQFYNYDHPKTINVNKLMPNENDFPKGDSENIVLPDFLR